MHRIRFWLIGIFSFITVTVGSIFVPGSFINRALLISSCTIFSFYSAFCNPNLGVEPDRVMAVDTTNFGEMQNNSSDLQQQKNDDLIDKKISADTLKITPERDKLILGQILILPNPEEQLLEQPPTDPRLEAIKNLTAREIANLINRDYSGWLNELPNCPCRREDINSSEFVQSSWFARQYRKIQDYHPGAEYDYRQTEATLREYKSPKNLSAVPIRPGQQCTYDINGMLITNGAGAGTPDIFGPEGTKIFSYLHTSWDVNTFENLGLDEYIKTWTPNNGNKCPINPKTTKGSSTNDPHLVTFDGLRYDLQSIGEVILTKSNDGAFEVQARQAPFSSLMAINSAVAVKVGSDRVALYTKDFPDGDTSNPLRVNGKPVTIQGDKLTLKGGGEILKQGSNYVISSPRGEKVLVSPTSFANHSFLNISPFVYNRAGKYSGLLGNVNGNPNDDLQIRGGGNISEIRSTYGDVNKVFSQVGLRLPGALDKGEKVYFDRLYKEFGDSWRVKQEESLFDYPAGKTTENYSDRSFPDKYLTLNMLSPEQIQKARNACTEAKITQDLMEGCIFDVGFSGFSEFARATAEINGYVNIVNQLFPGLKIPTTGQVGDQIIQIVKPKKFCPFGVCL